MEVQGALHSVFFGKPLLYTHTHIYVCGICGNETCVGSCLVFS